MTIKRLVLLGLIFLLAACGTPDPATPAPTPEAINVYYPASLQPWADRLSGCVENNSQIAVYFRQSGSSSSSLNPNDILLELGDPTTVGEGSFMAQVGWEQVVVVVNETNPLSQVSTDRLEQIFSGQILAWDSESGQPIQVWVLPVGETTRQIFDRALRMTQLLAPEARLAPDPGTMLEVVSQDENAIGYLPLSFLSASGKVKVIKLEPSLEQELHQPVIAITKNEPTGQARTIITCLQTSGD